MSDYAKNLRNASKTWSSAYLQFKTGKDREGYTAYSFVEDDDDKWFYQISLQNFRGICYISCGGKDQVVAVFQKLKSESNADGNLFFVDRDTENLPTEDSEEVLRTEMYSWESYVCQPDFVGRYLESQVDPNLSPGDVERVVSSWKSTLENFRTVLAQHAALCRTAAKDKKSFGLGEYRVKKPCNRARLVVGPHDTEKSLPQKYFDDALSKGCDRSAIERRVNIFIRTDLHKFGNGKLVFSILRIFVENMLHHLQRSMLGSYNSPIDWIKMMPWDREELNFIRAYATQRLKMPISGPADLAGT